MCTKLAANAWTSYATSHFHFVFLMIDCLQPHLGQTMHMKNEEQRDEKKKAKTLNTKQFTCDLKTSSKSRAHAPPTPLHIEMLLAVAARKSFLFFHFAIKHLCLAFIYLLNRCSADENRQSLLSTLVASAHKTHIIHSASESFSVVSKINTITTQNAHAHLWAIET